MAWTHKTSPILTLWLTLLIPFTIWDGAYIFLRPHSLPGGKWHAPFFSPNTHYASVDLMYSWKTWESGNGFVAAHCLLHLVECTLGATYLWVAFIHGNVVNGWTRVVKGKYARIAVVAGLVEGAMTLEMTLMCTFYEVLGGWPNLGHNSWSTLLGSWIFISSLYYLFSIYQIYWCASSILSGLKVAQYSPGNKKLS